MPSLWSASAHRALTVLVAPALGVPALVVLCASLPAPARATGKVTSRPALVDARCREVEHPARARRIYVSGDTKASFSAGGRSAGSQHVRLRAKDLSVHRVGHKRPSRAAFVRAGSCRGMPRYRWTGRVVAGAVYRVLYKDGELVAVVGEARSALAEETGVAFVRGIEAELFLPATAPPLKVGQQVAIIVPGARAVLQARVRRTTARPQRRPFLPFGAKTRRSTARLSVSKPLMPAVGLLSLARRAATLRSTRQGDLDGDGKPEHFRSCTSSEGIHLTVWAPPHPLVGKRLWHAYYYLGYDTEPSCKPADFAP